MMTKTLKDAKDDPETVEIEFFKGVPIKLNGKEMSGKEILSSLNHIGGEHGVGVIDLLENRMVGMKSGEYMKLQVEQFFGMPIRN